MGTGRIENLGQQQQGQVKIMVGRSHSGGVEVIGGTNGPAQPVQVTLHEEVIVEGQDNIRKKKDGTADLRFRNAPGKGQWDKIKRGDWEPK